MSQEPAKAKPSVLIVDDEEALRRAFVRTLQARGFPARSAGSAAEALGLLAEKVDDVVVSDVRMPCMDGFELLRALRAQEIDVPVILVTGAPSIETAARAVEFGALRYLIKPIATDELIAAIEHGAQLHKMAKLKHEAVTKLGLGSAQAGDLASVEAAFNRALESLWIAYQPVVALDQRKVVAYEALVRTREPSIPHPGALFSAAERLSRLHDLGRAIRHHIGRTLDATRPTWDTYVNIHPFDISDDTLFSSSSPIALHASAIVLEITERATLDNIGDVTPRIQRLREIGYRVAVDDLGAGYAGLSYFARLQPEVVKLDMSLVRDIDHDLTKQRVVASMASVCHELGMLVVAEGVETRGEREAVTALGCDLAQGYLFARPGPPYPDVNW